MNIGRRSVVFDAQVVQLSQEGVTGFGGKENVIGSVRITLLPYLKLKQKFYQFWFFHLQKIQKSDLETALVLAQRVQIFNLALGIGVDFDDGPSEK